MKKYIISILLFLSLFAVAHAAKKNYGHFHRVYYIKNYDADTITVTIGNVHPLLGERIGVRVNGIDSPEIRGKCPEEKALAKEAKYYVQTMLQIATRIDLLNAKRGKYFRIVADVEVDGQDLAKLLIEKGYAVPYQGGTKLKNWCAGY